MSANYWGDYLAAYRRQHGLKQTDLATILGVTAPTVSRWESGVHLPDLESQNAIKAKLGGQGTNTEADWRYKVETTHGIEFLIARGRGIVASSARARAIENLSAFLVTGFSDTNVDLETGEAKDAASSVQAGLYDGTLRFLHFTLDTEINGQAANCIVDVWPIVTTEHGVLTHAVAHPRQQSFGVSSTHARDLTCIKR